MAVRHADLYHFGLGYIAWQTSKMNDFGHLARIDSLSFQLQQGKDVWYIHARYILSKPDISSIKTGSEFFNWFT